MANDARMWICNPERRAVVPVVGRPITLVAVIAGITWAVRSGLLRVIRTLCGMATTNI
ncbi:MAG: hypothetical protein JOZ19_17340 [Rubrobacter sp.]|nr:hypothetical protein [Rubrobacter sp.]